VEDRARRKLEVGHDTAALAARLSRFCFLMVLGAGLTGCTSSGLDMFGGSKPDRSIATSTVPNQTKSTDTISDEVTVKNAVTSVDVARIGSNPIPWANASTGSAGVITTVQELEDNGTHCRQFRTTRHSFMGIAKFMGRTCMEQNGNWQLLSFQEEN
jgi:hypothetical protein